MEHALSIHAKLNAPEKSSRDGLYALATLMVVAGNDGLQYSQYVYDDGLQCCEYVYAATSLLSNLSNRNTTDEVDFVSSH